MTEKKTGSRRPKRQPSTPKKRDMLAFYMELRAETRMLGRDTAARVRGSRLAELTKKELEEYDRIDNNKSLRRIKTKHVLKNAKNLTGSTRDIWGDAKNIKGNAENISGDVTFIKGDVSNIEGWVERIHGDVSNIRGAIYDILGDVSHLRGDVSHIEGIVSDIKGDATELRGEVRHLLGKRDVLYD